MRNHGQCEGKLLYNSFSIIQLQTFCTEHLIPLESVPIQNTHSSVSDKEKKANRHETGPDRFIERIAEGNIDEQLFAHYTHNICRYRLGDFRIRIEVCYRAGEDRESPPTTALLEGRVHVGAAVFFNRTVQISYRFIVPKIPRNESDEPGRADERYDGLDPAEFCTTDHPFDTDQLISVAGIAQHVEHWVYNEKLDRQEIDGSLDKVEISDFKLDKDSVFRPEGTGEGNLTFDEVQRRYRNYFDKTPQAEFRAPDHRYIYIDVWEDIAHTGDTDFGKMVEDEIIEHIETAHRTELVGLMTLYPMEWPYRMDSSYEDVCGRNIAIDTDDLVLANQNMSVVFGTYGRRGKGSPTDWKEHLARRDRYHVSWPEYLVLLEIVLAKKQTINYVLNRYIDNSRRAIRSNVHDMIEQNAQLTVELSGILMRLNSVRYLRYMSHKHMFELTQRNLRVEEDSRQLQEVMQQVDKSLENVNNMMEIRHADDTKYILLFISIASLFGVLLQSEDVPILSLLSYRFGVGSAIILEVFTFAVILIALRTFGKTTRQYIRRKRNEQRMNRLFDKES